MYCNTFENLSAKFTTRSDLLYLDSAGDRDSYKCVIGEVKGRHSPDDINETLDSIGSMISHERSQIATVQVVGYIGTRSPTEGHKHATNQLPYSNSQ